MYHRLKQLILLLIGLCPFQQIKHFLFNYYAGYKIEKTAYIGFSFIDVDMLTMDAGSRVGHFNRIQGAISLKLMERSCINFRNRILVSRWRQSHTSLCLGSTSIITRQHFFDMIGNIRIGSNTVIGGFDSQFWTHGFDTERNLRNGDIEIGDNCFIGSSVRFSLGAKIPDNCIVGVGAVVTRQFNEENKLIAGVPARIIKTL